MFVASVVLRVVRGLLLGLCVRTLLLMEEVAVVVAVLEPSLLEPIEHVIDVLRLVRPQIVITVRDLPNERTVENKHTNFDFT